MIGYVLGILVLLFVALFTALGAVFTDLAEVLDQLREWLWADWRRAHPE